ncbi:putative transcription regulator GNAT family [Dioscorea sansibarensis]
MQIHTSSFLRTSTPKPFRPIASFSISDQELQSRGFTQHRSSTDLDLESLNTVFARVGFPRRDLARIRRALDHSSSLLWLSHSKRGEPVAFARATGDGVFNAVVWDVVVDPSFQGIGLGRAVMERIVADLRGMGIVNIALYAEPRVIGFYRPLGFAADPDGIKGCSLVSEEGLCPNYLLGCVPLEGNGTRWAFSGSDGALHRCPFMCFFVALGSVLSSFGLIDLHIR